MFSSYNFNFHFPVDLLLWYFTLLRIMAKHLNIKTHQAAVWLASVFISRQMNIIMRNPRNINNQNEPTQPDQDRPKHRDAANYLETSTTLMQRQARQEDNEVKSPLSHLLLISWMSEFNIRDCGVEINCSECDERWLRAARWWLQWKAPRPPLALLPPASVISHEADIRQRSGQIAWLWYHQLLRRKLFSISKGFCSFNFVGTVLLTWFVAKFNTISPTRTKYNVKKHNKGGLLTSGSASEVCTALMRTRPETIFAVSWAPGV